LQAAQRIALANTKLWVLLEPKNYVPPADVKTWGPMVEGDARLTVPNIDLSGRDLFDDEFASPYGDPALLNQTTTTTTTTAPAAASGAPAAAGN
jgi:hypothetical protein